MGKICSEKESLEIQLNAGNKKIKKMEKKTNFLNKLPIPVVITFTVATLAGVIFLPVQAAGIPIVMGFGFIYCSLTEIDRSVDKLETKIYQQKRRMDSLTKEKEKEVIINKSYLTENDKLLVGKPIDKEAESQKIIYEKNISAKAMESQIGETQEFKYRKNIADMSEKEQLLLARAAVVNNKTEENSKTLIRK